MSFGTSAESSEAITDTISETVGTTDTETTGTSQLVLSDEAIESYIDDALSAESGLADIFTEERVAGLYDSTVSSEATSDLMANIVGELAELTGTTVTTEESTTDFETLTETDEEEDTTSVSAGFSL